MVSISTTAVAVVGNYYLLPLQEDLQAKTYMGYIPKTEQGWLDWIGQRPGWKEDEISQRQPILYRVGPDVQPYEVKDPQGQAVPRFESARVSWILYHRAGWQRARPHRAAVFGV